jgi:hypothetical protein
MSYEIKRLRATACLRDLVVDGTVVLKAGTKPTEFVKSVIS